MTGVGAFTGDEITVEIHPAPPDHGPLFELVQGGVTHPIPVAVENIIEMERRSQPVRAIIGASHNTSPYGDANTYQAQTLHWVVRHTKDLADSHGLEFIPASFAQMRAEADRMDAW